MVTWVIYITSGTSYDEGVSKVLMAMLNNTGCLFLSLPLGFPLYTLCFQSLIRLNKL